MRQFLASLVRHAPDAEADTRIRDGYVSQIRLHALLEQAVNRGDLRRSELFALRQSHRAIDMSGLAEDIDMSADPPVFPRDTRVWATDEDQNHVDSDERGLSPTGLLRPKKFLALASELGD